MFVYNQNKGMPLWIGSMGRMIGLQIRGVNLLGGSGTLLSLHEAFLDQEYRTSPWRTTCTEAWELFKAREYKHLHVLLLNMLLLRSCLVVTTKSHTWHTIRLDNATCHWNKLQIKMVSQGRPTIVLFRVITARCYTCMSHEETECMWHSAAATWCMNPSWFELQRQIA